VNNASAAGRDVAVFVGPGSLSQVILPSQNVITVSSVNSYISTYPSTTAPASGYFTGGDTVYVRAVVSDPFGSYDINSNPPGTLPAITIRDSSNTVIVNAAATTQVADSGGLTKTFEYVYTVPGTGPSGVWSANVNAPEGTESMVSDNGIGTFRVMLMPSITAVKAVSTYSDPYNNTTNPKSIPGAVMLYTVTVVNSGLGPVDANTMTVTDPVPANTSMCVSTLCSNPPVAFTCSAIPACGLTYTYATAVVYTNQPGGVGPYNYTPVPDASGFDAAVTGFSINPAGAFNGVGGPPYAQFTIQFRVKVK